MGTRRCAFSLLEVILSLAILAGAMAVLGEVGALAMRNARVARDSTQAQLLCESKLAEIAAGITPAEAVQSAAFDQNTASTELSSYNQQSEWLYSIDVENIDEEGLVAVRVTVTQNLPPEQRPLQCSLVRWIAGSGLEVSTDTTEESTGSKTSE